MTLFLILVAILVVSMAAGSMYTCASDLSERSSALNDMWYNIRRAAKVICYEHGGYLQMKMGPKTEWYLPARVLCYDGTVIYVTDQIVREINDE